MFLGFIYHACSLLAMTSLILSN